MKPKTDSPPNLAAEAWERKRVRHYSHAMFKILVSRQQHARALLRFSQQCAASAGQSSASTSLLAPSAATFSVGNKHQPYRKSAA
jgi:hypothetical protein